jgi:hypothetical protein
MLSCLPKTGPKVMLGLDLSECRSNGKKESIFSRIDHHEAAQSRSAARTYSCGAQVARTSRKSVECLRSANRPTTAGAKITGD